MNKIQIFYHMYCINDCYERFNITFNKIVLSGLIEHIDKINVILVGPEKENLKNKIKDFSKVSVFVKHNNNTEAETLHMVWNYSQTNSGYVLYLHSKGVTRHENECMHDWKNLMEYFLIERFELCLNALKDHDVCGVNFLIAKNKPHFSGNFWWSTTNHIKKLKNIKPDISDRFYCEFWLFDTTEKINHKELHASKIDHYGSRYPRQIYAME